MRTLYRRILLFLYPYFLLTEVLTDLLIYYFSININPTPACSSVTDYLGSKPSRELLITLFHYSFIEYPYFTATFTVSLPTVTNTTPAGAAIVALSEVRTVSATVWPNTVRT